MSNIIRKHHKIFAGSATNNGQFGSAQLGTKVNSNDPDVIQALSAYDQGWNSATTGGTQLPTLEEMQGLQYNNSYQIAYLLQKGIPEWNTSTDYHIGDITREVAGTKLYKSITNNNIGNVLTDVANWEFLGNLGLATTTTQGISYLSKPVTIANNATDADHYMDFGAGNFDFDDGSGQATLSALTKQFDSTFALGTNAGGMVNGESLPTSDLVYIFQISNPSGTITDIIGTTTRDGSTISGDPVVTFNSLTKKKYLCALPTDASNNILAGQYFVDKSGYKFRYKDYILVDTSGYTSRTAISMRVPPNSIVNFLASAGSTNTTITYTLYTNLSDTDSTPSLNNCSHAANLNFAGFGEFFEITNSSGQIGKKSNNVLTSSNNTRTKGWEEKY